ncbi:hypothetical protein PG996_006743 [Apiospora saccharicola]|uniref:Uncharacterized protein n=1 Tax=Apiospora saccharicola TaxID=335842 RepID=A0ABR1V8V5_9PEZI
MSKGIIYLHGNFSTSPISLVCRGPDDRVDDIWVPALDAWLYKNPHLCYYVATRSPNMYLLARVLQVCHIPSSYPGGPPPKQSALNYFFRWLRMFLSGRLIVRFPNTEFYL